MTPRARSRALLLLACLACLLFVLAGCQPITAPAPAPEAPVPEATATEEVTPAEEIATTEEMTATEEMTSTEAMTATEEVTLTEQLTPTGAITPTEEMTAAEGDLGQVLTLIPAPDIPVPDDIAALSRSGAQGNLELSLAYVNRIGGGYNPSTHTYEQEFIENTLTEPKDRPVQADVCSFLPRREIPMTSTEDGGHCADQTVRTLPDGVSAVVMTLTGPHPLLNQTRVLQEFRISEENFLGSGTCRPLQPVRVVTQCSFTFSVPLPSNMVAGLVDHSIKAEVVGDDGQLLLTTAKAIAVPRSIPLIVSVGESLASGEGNPNSRGRSERHIWEPLSQRDCFDDTTVMILRESKPDMTSQPTWYDKRDHRSLKSGPALAARSLLNDWPYVVFLSFAKSGAEIDDIVDQLRQVKEVVGDHKIDALLISAGGNDVGFSNVLEDMAGDFRGSDAELVLSKFLERILVLRNEEYPKLNQAIVDLNLNVGEVLINEYPGKLFNRADGEPARGCGVFDTFTFWSVSKRDAVAMNRMGDVLNDDVRLLAEKHGWRFVSGISSEFAEHGYCSAQSFYRSAEDSCDQQGDFDGTMHPNEEGTAVYARALELALREVLPPPPVPASEWLFVR